MRSVLVTGAGRGLGLALVRRSLARGDRVFAAVRDRSAFEEAHPRLTVVTLDVTEPRSIASAVGLVAAQIDGLDVLFNNAGIHAGSPHVRPEHRNQELGALETEGLVQMFRVNAVGPALVTQAFTALLARGTHPIVVDVSSRKGSLTNRTEGGNYAYSASKAAQNMITRALAIDLAPLGITAVAVHPGRVRTRMAGPDAELEPEESADALLALTDRLGPADAGRFFYWDGREHPW